jgi:pimeloyl-ACP methyl ester carboxylesterase
VVRVSILERDSAGGARFGETLAEAITRDAAIGDLDWTVPAPGAVLSRFAAPSGDLATVSLGDPTHPRVVLVPGVTGSKEDFVLMLPLLAEAGYYVQSYDLAGQYESATAGPAEGSRYEYELFYDDLIAFLEAGAPAHLLGYSFAGTIAQLVLTRRPELVLSLALMTTSPDVGNGYRGMKWIGPFSRFITPRQGASLLIWGIVTNKNKVPPGRLAFVQARFAYTRRDSVDDIVRLMKHTPDLRDPVRAADIPKLVVIGEHDLWPVERHAAFAERIGAQLAVYDTGHSPCETTPHQLTRDLLALYARVDAS